MLDSSAFPQSARTGLPLLLLLFTMWYLAALLPSSDLVHGFSDARDVFAADVVADDFFGGASGGGPALREVCAAKNWARGEGIVLQCESAAGGPGMVRTMHLNCLRLAIEAGVEVILPRIVKRPNSDRSKLRPKAKGFIKGEPMAHFWDEEHTVSSLETWCPQLTVHRSLDDLWDVSSLIMPQKAKLADVASLDGDGLMVDPSAFADSFHHWLDGKKPVDKRKLPLRIELSEFGMAWPQTADSAAFNRQFGALVRTRKDIVRLAGSILYEISSRFAIPMNPRQGWTGDSFVGVDLRTLYDSRDVLPSSDAQSNNYLVHLESEAATLAYLTNGASDDDVEAFAKSAKDLKVTTVRARELLPDDTQRREGYLPLTWDQRALVDFEVLWRAGSFVGAAGTEFAWDVALRRHFSGNATAEDGSAGGGGGGVQFDDGRSVLFGEGTDARFRTVMWP